MMDHDEEALDFFTKIYLCFTRKGMKLAYVCERDRDRDTKTRGGYEGFEHCYIDP